MIAATAVILHARPLGERSRILELLTLETGRRAVVGYGSQALLRPFVVMRLHWREHPELPRLREAEELQAFGLQRRPLVCGLYLNELVLKLFPRDAPVGDLLPELLRAYVELEQGVPPHQVLRRAEWMLLREIDSGLAGIALAGLDPEARYRYLPGEGVVPSRQSAVGRSVSGQCLTALASDQSVPDHLAREARDFMRGLIEIHLEGKEIRSRLLL